MTILIKNVNMSVLGAHADCDYVLVGDASVEHHKERTAWCCFMLDKHGTGEVLYGIDKHKTDSHVVELTPYLKAMRTLRNRLPSNTVYKKRLHIITDNKNIVGQFTGNTSNFYTSGIWKEIRSYDTQFDSFFEFQKRRSNRILEFVDDICEILKESHGSVEERVRKACRQKTSYLNMDSYLINKDQK